MADTTLTPMMQQYLGAKEENPGAILFFRLGDFYEMFFDDAKLVSRELGLTLTSRSGDVDKTPMCGVPYHAADGYIARLIAKGYKVAIAEQIGDPKAKGLTKREVIKIITPGTVLSEDILTHSQNNYILLVHEAVEESAGRIILAGADISTGECFYAAYSSGNAAQLMLDELYRRQSPELIFSADCSAELEQTVRNFAGNRLANIAFSRVENPLESARVDELLAQHFTIEEATLTLTERQAIAELLAYLHVTVRTQLAQINRLTRLDTSAQLRLDSATLRNLEVTRNLRDGGKKHTLLDVLDFTHTPMGSRLLKSWLEYPLLDRHHIDSRLAAVDELFSNFSLRSSLRSELKDIYDFERLLTRIETQTANARDLVALRASLGALPAIKTKLGGVKARKLRQIAAGIDLFTELKELLLAAVVDEPAFSLREGGIIRSGFNTELDEYRVLAHDSKSMLQKIEERERETTGIRTLKIGYNKVFGYYIEVRHSGADLVPDRYIRKQTLTNAERYITEELKEFETKILGAQEKIVNLEYHIFTELREAVKKELVAIQVTAREIARLDVLQSLAEAASQHRYVRPTITSGRSITIKDGRHPLVERILKRDLFVPNDASLGSNVEIMLITGPNMAGKSTYMRQVALLTLMAQAGSFVPAREMTLAPVDQIFTRIGASDDLVSGQSTFMMEMNEVAQILANATKDSLIILDEIGRGTSTFDGMSIAKSVVEYIDARIHAKTLFATHYHELTDMENERIKNFCIAVKEKGREVAFLRRIIAGAADKSYGIHVARLAGLPKRVIDRAEEILTGLEAEGGSVTSKLSPADDNGGVDSADIMESLFASSLKDELIALDIMSMTPLEAINTLFRLQTQAKEETGRL